MSINFKTVVFHSRRATVYTWDLQAVLILQLPNELLLHICSYLSTNDILSLAGTCRQLRSILFTGFRPIPRLPALRSCLHGAALVLADMYQHAELQRPVRLIGRPLLVVSKLEPAAEWYESTQHRGCWTSLTPQSRIVLFSPKYWAWTPNDASNYPPNIAGYISGHPEQAIIYCLSGWIRITRSTFDPAGSGFDSGPRFRIILTPVGAIKFSWSPTRTLDIAVDKDQVVVHHELDVVCTIPLNQLPNKWMLEYTQAS